MGDRGDRFKLRALKQKESKSINGPKKAAERVRREKRMIAALKAAKPPYGKLLRSWLAVKLNKPEAELTADDAQKVLKAASA